MKDELCTSSLPIIRTNLVARPSQKLIWSLLLWWNSHWASLVKWTIGGRDYHAKFIYSEVFFYSSFCFVLFKYASYMHLCQWKPGFFPHTHTHKSPFDFNMSSAFFIAVQTHFSSKCIVRVNRLSEFFWPVSSVFILVLDCRVFVLTNLLAWPCQWTIN